MYGDRRERTTVCRDRRRVDSCVYPGARFSIQARKFRFAGCRPADTAERNRGVGDVVIWASRGLCPKPANTPADADRFPVGFQCPLAGYR
jgi:hypothetical protein